MTDKCKECMKETFSLRCGSCDVFGEEDHEEEMMSCDGKQSTD